MSGGEIDINERQAIGINAALTIDESAGNEMNVANDFH